MEKKTIHDIIVTFGNKFIQSVKEDCCSNVILELSSDKIDNVSMADVLRFFNR